MVDAKRRKRGQGKMNSTETHLTRAYQRLAAARLLAKHGFDGDALSRLYYAAAEGTSAALAEMGLPSVDTTNSRGLIASLSFHVVREERATEEMLATLVGLEVARTKADNASDRAAAQAHGPYPALDKVDDALRRATEFVEAIRREFAPEFVPPELPLERDVETVEGQAPKRARMRSPAP